MSNQNPENPEPWPFPLPDPASPGEPFVPDQPLPPEPEQQERQRLPILEETMPTMPTMPDRPRPRARMVAQTPTEVFEEAMAQEPKTPPVKTPAGKKCEIGNVLPKSVIDLIRAAPMNETVRAVLLAHLHIPVPDEKKTFPEIREWIESTIEPGLKTKITQVAQPERRDVISLPVTVIEDETGRCSYSVTNTGAGNIPADRDEITNMAIDAEDAEHFYQLVTDHCHEDWRDHVSANNQSEMSYSDHDQDDDNSSSVELTDEAKRMLRERIREASPEAYEELFGGD